MARLPRLAIPDFPHHVIQRGNNRQPIFMDLSDREHMLGLLGTYAQKFEVALHAYVLMDNHFHLLATPVDRDGLPLMMQAVGRSYVRHFNDRHRRTGTLWEGRYKATVVQTERYLLACMAYIDLNPVRAHMVELPEEFPWSSHGHYIGRRVDRLITPHPFFWELGNTPFAREAAYAELVHQGVSAARQAEITRATTRGWALGDEKFVAELQKSTERRLIQTRAGRPSRLQSSD